jgi:hypothetical protein
LYCIVFVVGKHLLFKHYTSFNHPVWALAHKRPGTELRLVREKYYLSEYKTVYNKAQTVARKISCQQLGSVTEKDGFIASANQEELLFYPSPSPQQHAPIIPGTQRKQLHIRRFFFHIQRKTNLV